MKIKISGMHCSGCAKNIEETLKENKIKAKVDIKTNSAEIEDSKINEAINIITNLGYKTQ